MLEFPPYATDDDFLLPEGDYKFYVKDAKEHLGRSGKLSIKLTVVVIDDKGKEHQLFDYLSPDFALKLKHFCDGTGLSEVYLTGRLEYQMCIGRHGRCKVKREAGDERFDPKNSIKDYCKVSAANAAAPSATEGFDDNLNDLTF